jgi:hypothetical protein
VHQGIENYQLKRASISIEALPNLAPLQGSRQIASESVKVTQLSHSERRLRSSSINSIFK